MRYEMEQGRAVVSGTSGTSGSGGMGGGLVNEIKASGIGDVLAEAENALCEARATLVDIGEKIHGPTPEKEADGGNAPMQGMEHQAQRIRDNAIRILEILRTLHRTL